jgi:hypothetical protein
MATDPNSPLNPTPKTLDQLLAESLRENERLRRQVEDAHHERDMFKKYYLDELARNAPELTPEIIANAIPARPMIEQLIRRLENP